MVTEISDKGLESKPRFVLARGLGGNVSVVRILDRIVHGRGDIKWYVETGERINLSGRNYVDGKVVWYADKAVNESPVLEYAQEILRKAPPGTDYILFRHRPQVDSEGKIRSGKVQGRYYLKKGVNILDEDKVLIDD